MFVLRELQDHGVGVQPFSGEVGVLHFWKDALLEGLDAIFVLEVVGVSLLIGISHEELVNVLLETHDVIDGPFCGLIVLSVGSLQVHFGSCVWVVIPHLPGVTEL